MSPQARADVPEKFSSASTASAEVLPSVSSSASQTPVSATTAMGEASNFLPVTSITAEVNLPLSNNISDVNVPSASQVRKDAHKLCKISVYQCKRAVKNRLVYVGKPQLFTFQDRRVMCSCPLSDDQVMSRKLAEVLFTCSGPSSSCCSNMICLLWWSLGQGQATFLAGLPKYPIMLLQISLNAEGGLQTDQIPWFCENILQLCLFQGLRFCMDVSSGRHRQRPKHSEDSLIVVMMLNTFSYCFKEGLCPSKCLWKFEESYHVHPQCKHVKLPLIFHSLWSFITAGFTLRRALSGSQLNHWLIQRISQALLFSCQPGLHTLYLD